MNRLKIVIVSGVIFPRIAPRAFRATELAKALAKSGHDVTLISSLGKYDYSSFTQETGIKVKNLGCSSFATKNSDGKIPLPLWKKGIIFFLSRLCEFPDILLMKRVKKAVEAEGDVDLLISIAVPYPIHWGVTKVKAPRFKTWISDCGDPYMGNSIKKPPFYFSFIEKRWGNLTDFITVPLEGAKTAYYEEFRNKIHVIPQGFDFELIPSVPYKENPIPTFMYTGLFYPEKRDPTKLLEYLQTLDMDFRFIVYTSNASLVLPFKDKLGVKLEINDVIPRETLLQKIGTADFLINISNDGTSAQVPSKLIDYALMKRPILEISSNFDEHDKNNLHAFFDRNYSNQKVVQDIEQYNISNISQRFVSLHFQKHEDK